MTIESKYQPILADADLYEASDATVQIEMDGADGLPEDVSTYDLVTFTIKTEPSGTVLVTKTKADAQISTYDTNRDPAVHNDGYRVALVAGDIEHGIWHYELAILDVGDRQPVIAGPIVIKER